jgi:sulfur carrier protein
MTCELSVWCAGGSTTPAFLFVGHRLSRSMTFACRSRARLMGERMQVTYRERYWSFDETLTVTQLLKRIDVLPESALVVRNGQLVTEDQVLKPEDTVKVVAVISGG